jgi:hypothetical protein
LIQGVYDFDTLVKVCSTVEPSPMRQVGGNNMTTQPKHNISTERATDLLKDGQPLTDIFVGGEIKIETDKTWDKEIVIENCIVEYFSGNVTRFEKPVRLINPHHPQ